MVRYGFIGGMRVGKDTAADFLKQTAPGPTLKFADPLYQIQEAIYKISRLTPPEGGRDRGLLQFIGTDWGRKTINPDIWINVMQATLSEIPKGANIYLTDVRFPNEFRLLDQFGILKIKIKRPLEDRILYGATNLTHESETALDHIPDSEYDSVIENNGTLDEFYAKLKALL